YIATALWGLGTILSPTLPGDTLYGVTAIGIAVLSAVLGLASLIVLYNHDRDRFPFIFALFIGFSAMNRGLGEIHPSSVAVSVFFLALSCTIPVTVALILRDAILRIESKNQSREPDQ
ncbi:MAG: hypothetical protein WBC95_15945, partial [Albidovulum sp.]